MSRRRGSTVSERFLPLMVTWMVLCIGVVPADMTITYRRCAMVSGLFSSGEDRLYRLDRRSQRAEGHRWAAVAALDREAAIQSQNRGWRFVWWRLPQRL